NIAPTINTIITAITTVSNRPMPIRRAPYLAIRLAKRRGATGEFLGGPAGLFCDCGGSLEHCADEETASPHRVHPPRADPRDARRDRLRLCDGSSDAGNREGRGGDPRSSADDGSLAGARAWSVRCGADPDATGGGAWAI